MRERIKASLLSKFAQGRAFDFRETSNVNAMLETITDMVHGDPNGILDPVGVLGEADRLIYSRVPSKTEYLDELLEERGLRFDFIETLSIKRGSNGDPLTTTLPDGTKQFQIDEAHREYLKRELTHFDEYARNNEITVRELVDHLNRLFRGIFEVSFGDLDYVEPTTTSIPATSLDPSTPIVPETPLDPSTPTDDNFIAFDKPGFFDQRVWK